MSIGLRTLGGDPEAFYRLDHERQIDILAVLKVERDGTPSKKGGAGPRGVERVNYASEEARAHWSHAFRS